MAKVINLNRFRKKKAKEAKERRAEQNRRLHGRTKGERMAEELQKSRLEKKLDGALLIPERVKLDEIQQIEPQQALTALNAMTEKAISLSEFSARLVQQREETSGSDED